MNYNAYKTVFYEVFQNSDYSSEWTNGDIEYLANLYHARNVLLDDMIIGMDLMIEERRREARDKKINQILEAIDNKNS